MDFDFQYFIELFFGGLTRGSIYALIALGYTLVYGIIGLLNFAHGEIYMIGAFTALLFSGVLGYIGFPAGGILLVAALGSIIWTSAYGYTLEKVAYKPLRNASRLSHLGHRYVHVPPELRPPGPDLRLCCLPGPPSRYGFSLLLRRCHGAQ